MDPLSEVLSLLKLHSYLAGGFDVGGNWSIRFGPHEGIKCYALVSGSCWLVVEGVPEPIRLGAGECFLLPRGWPFRLTSDPALPPLDVHALPKVPANGGFRTWNGGGGCMAVGGYFAYTGAHARLLLEDLPPVVHLRSEADRAQLRWSLERMRDELQAQRPGAALVVEQLATTMLVQALRLHVEDGFTGKAGWLVALADPQIKTAITLMHDTPGYPWALEELATRSGMSRSVFALRFKTTVGTSPMEYLTRWRMLLAGDRLRHTEESVASVAAALGYESESAFSKAFRRVMTCSPRQYRRGTEAETGVALQEEGLLLASAS